MSIRQPEKRNAKIAFGVLPAVKIQKIAASHPFTQQLDIVFPSDRALVQAISKFEPSYGKGRGKLSDIVSRAGTFVNSVEGESNLLMLSIGDNEDDAWCIDTRGLLTLLLSKNTYERLGLIGEKLPFKNYRELHVIRIPLRQNAESVTNQARRNAALEIWDKIRDEQGLGPWTVLYCSKDPTTILDFPASPGSSIVVKVQREMTTLQDVHIPVLSITPRPSSSKLVTEEVNDWNHDMAALFEWAGMASFGAQRLKANDRVDPFVALYEPPTPSRIGNVACIRWKGLLAPDFVQAVVDTALASVQSSCHADAQNTFPFVSITSHAFSESPVSYIPLSAFAPGSGVATKLESPVRVPRAAGEDTWSAIVAASPEGVKWSLVESLGQWDTRWG